MTTTSPTTSSTGPDWAIGYNHNQTVIRTAMTFNHNQTVIRTALSFNHNQTVVTAKAL